MQNKDAYRHILDAVEDLSEGTSVEEILEFAADWLSGAHAWQFLKRPLRLSLRASIEVTGATYTHAARTLTLLSAFTDYELVTGDRIEVTGGTGATVKAYPIESRTNGNVIVLAAPGLGAAADAAADIDFLMPNDSIALPSDFMAFPDAQPLWATDSIVTKLVLTSHEVLTMNRTANTRPVTEGSGLFTGVVTELVDPATGETLPVLELWPPSASDVPDAFQGYYRARIAIDTEQEGNAIPIPRSRKLVELLLVLACKKVAMGLSEGMEVGNPSLEVLLEELMASRLWRSACAQDGLAQGSIGPLRGGVGGARGVGRRMLASEVEGPT